MILNYSRNYAQNVQWTSGGRLVFTGNSPSSKALKTLVKTEEPERPPVINLHDVEDIEQWVRDPNNVYIGRGHPSIPDDIPTIWGNPFHDISTTEKRIESINQYRLHVLDTKALLDKLPELRNKTLGCTCKPDLCHGDVLHELERLRRSSNKNKKSPKSATPLTKALSRFMPKSLMAAPAE